MSQELTSLQSAYLEKQVRLWTSLLAGRPERLAEPAPGDRRFSHPQWRENAYFNYLQQSYLLAAQYLEQALDAVPIEEGERGRARFALKQWIDALCPANFPATNPQALEEAIASGGESLSRGVANLLRDVQAGRIRQSDESAFELGRNLAVTPGTVVYENELMQLIQYSPATAEVAARPLLMVPPCINKFYVLDLRPENSFVAYAVASGHTVFMISWRNVGPAQGHLGWDDYVERGVLKAMRVACDIARAERVNVLGFCVGGTLLGAALAALAARHEPLVSSATFLAAMLDFAEPGQIGLFVDAPSVAAHEAAIGQGGVFSGAHLALMFSTLRANDLVWPYVVKNYLLGESPPAFDVLHWNADSTNLPGPMFCHYVRHTYLENRLRHEVEGVRVPAFVLATREDHIVPWRAAYRTLDLLGGEDKTFVLGASGHVAGVVNPPEQRRRSYWSAPLAPGEGPDAWLARAHEAPGSWWPLWSAWLARHAGGTREAPPAPGSVQYKAVEAAPGRYVKERAQ